MALPTPFIFHHHTTPVSFKIFQRPRAARKGDI